MIETLHQIQQPEDPFTQIVGMILMGGNRGKKKKRRQKELVDDAKRRGLRVRHRKGETVIEGEKPVIKES